MRLAYPNLVTEAIAIETFLDALTEADQRMRVQQVYPKALDEAVHAAVSMEAWQSKEKQISELREVHQHKNNQNGPKKQQSSYNGIQLMLREILKTSQNNIQANNGQNSHYSKQQAYNQ